MSIIPRGIGALGYTVQRPVDDRFLYSDQTAHEIGMAVRAHLEAARARAFGILQDNRAALDEGAASLLAHKTLGAEELPKVKGAGVV